MVIGNRRVPLGKVRLCNAEGQFKDVWLADLSSRRVDAHGRYQKCVFWSSIGGDCPWCTPLVDEIKRAIQSLRIRKGRKGNLLGEDGKVLPGVVPIAIRGHELLAENNAHTLRVNLGDSLDTMKWFLKDIWNDLQTFPGSLAAQWRRTGSRTRTWWTALASCGPTNASRAPPTTLDPSASA